MVKGRPLKDVDIGASVGLCRAEHSNMKFSDIIGILVHVRDNRFDLVEPLNKIVSG